VALEPDVKCCLNGIAVVLLLLLTWGAASPALAEPQMLDPCPEGLDRVSFPSGEWVGILVFDATGDGLPDVFIADTNRGGNAGEPWRLNRATPGGGFEIVGSVFFHPKGFRLVGTRLETYWRSNAASGTFVTYRISDESITQIEKTELLYANDPEYERRSKAISDWRPNLQGSWFSALRTEAGERRCREQRW
jgi:hypothetical protein